jgi:hypothetical protein
LERSKFATKLTRLLSAKLTRRALILLLIRAINTLVAFKRDFDEEKAGYFLRN